MSLRKLRVYVSQLPIDSATARSQNGNDWGSTEYILRAFMDEFRVYRREFASANGAKEGDLGTFEPTPVPGVKADEEKPDVDSATVYQMFEEMRKRGKVA